MNEKGTAVRMTNVSKNYLMGKVAVEALKAITLEIPRKRFNVIIGPSGSGKTTLLNLIGCIDFPSSGRIEICGQDVAGLSDNETSDFRARNIGFIFQNFNLIPVLSAYENVEYPLLLTQTSARERREKVQQMIDAVGLFDHRHHRPNELSGGQRQRVAIARALVKGPELVLADEPTANLDSKTGRSIIDLMHEMQSKNNTTFIFSSHDKQIMDHAEEVFVIQDGQLVDNGREGRS
ncbi:MAG: ABC transporter ATP-binding protein [Deltaproteobacteria bacterium]|nr:ABC transporter ATP-binding protein [Deltaproteobacteria bacterium]